MRYARIRLTGGNHKEEERRISLFTIFGDIWVSKKNIIDNGGEVLVPVREFANKGVNPCQMVDGYEGLVESR